jgi:PAS domain S-box-containing protein
MGRRIPRRHIVSVEGQYRALLGAISDAVVVLDAELRIEDVNDRAAGLLGAGGQDLLGHRWFDALDMVGDDGQEDAQVRPPDLTDPAWQEVSQEQVHRVRRGDGQCVAVRCRWTPLDGGSGGVHGYVLTMRDVAGARTASVATPEQRTLARRAAGLTPREHEVLELLADGRDAVEIARRLDLSLHSVRGHIKSLLRKLRVHSQLQAVVVAARLGIVDVFPPGPTEPTTPNAGRRMEDAELAAPNVTAPS